MRANRNDQSDQRHNAHDVRWQEAMKRKRKPVTQLANVVRRKSLAQPPNGFAVSIPNKTTARLNITSQNPDFWLPRLGDESCEKSNTHTV